nr:MAG TPA: hypothetical protein [Caudoviricetes sp.]
MHVFGCARVVTPLNTVKIDFVQNTLNSSVKFWTKRKAPRIAPRGLICFYRYYFRF